MGDDKPLKSAFELAMERLRRKDRDDGVEESHPLSEEQKAEIARLRQEAKAKLAEREILHRKDLAAAGGDPAKIEKLEENYRVDRARIESRLETAIEKVRHGG
jgi:hypothetical protein